MSPLCVRKGREGGEGMDGQAACGLGREGCLWQPGDAGP